VNIQIAKSPESRQQIAFYVSALVLALIVLAGGWFTYVKPSSSKASFLAARETKLQQEASAADTSYQEAQRLSKVQLADLFDLTRAMPDQPRIADVLVVLGRLAENSGVTFQSITPSPAIPLAGYSAQPMEIVLQGRFYDLMEFLYELRHLVDVRQDAGGATKLYATGRLFTVNTISIDLMHTGDPNKPELTATIGLDAFVYGSPAAAPGAAPATTGTTSTTTSTTTTSGTASAAGAPTGGTG
jgi:Tfp pilus assembly protein PilO